MLKANGFAELDHLATEYMRQLRQGNKLTVNEFAARYPYKSEAITRLFPAIASMESLRTASMDASGTLALDLNDLNINLPEPPLPGISSVAAKGRLQLGTTDAYVPPVLLAMRSISRRLWPRPTPMVFTTMWCTSFAVRNRSKA